jgi:Zn-finger nucleic acid-binding protein
MITVKFLSLASFINLLKHCKISLIIMELKNVELCQVLRCAGIFCGRLGIEHS